MVCPYKNMTRLFKEQVKKLNKWMHTHHTDPELAPLITEHLLGRGEVKGLAKTQDAIGWRNFTKGKLSKTFRRVQKSYLVSADTNLTVDSWMKSFVGKFFEMTHSQWIFRCISKHHHTQGLLALASKEELIGEIERQLEMGVDAIAEEDRWMLEIDMEELKESLLAE